MSKCATDGPASSLESNSDARRPGGTLAAQTEWCVCVLTDDSQSGIISTIVSISISEASQHSTHDSQSPIGPVRVTCTVRSASKSLISHRNPVHFTQAPYRLPIGSPDRTPYRPKIPESL